jgi:hypothetical protein
MTTILKAARLISDNNGKVDYEYLKRYWLGIAQCCACSGFIPESMKLHAIPQCTEEIASEILMWLAANCKVCRFVATDTHDIFEIKFKEPQFAAAFFIPPDKDAPDTTIGAGSR